MKAYTSLIFIFNFIIFIKAKEEDEIKDHQSLLFSVAIGQSKTNISMFFNTFSTNLTLYSNTNRKYALEINKKRNNTYIIDSLTIDELTLQNLVFNIKLDPTDFHDNSILSNSVPPIIEAYSGKALFHIPSAHKLNTFLAPPIK